MVGVSGTTLLQTYVIVSSVRLGCLVVERRRVCYVAKTLGGECEPKTFIVEGGEVKVGTLTPNVGR